MVEGKTEISDARMAESVSSLTNVLDKSELAPPDIPNIYYASHIKI